MPEPTNSPTTGVQPATEPATGVQPVSGVQPGVPFQDLTKWATKAPEGETLISTAYRDKVTDDLKFVENKPGVHKPDPILVADNVTRKFGGMTAVEFTGTHYDMGNKLGIMKANCEVALKHPEIGESFKAYLKELVKTLD